MIDQNFRTGSSCRRIQWGWFPFYLLVFVCCGNVRDVDQGFVGVPLELAGERWERLSEIHYELTLQIPESKDERILGRLALSFDLRLSENPLAVDFRVPADQVMSVNLNGRSDSHSVQRGQILLDAASLKVGRNLVLIDFVAGDSPLNRRENLLYALFVPDRASQAFPCFDQPNLKARFSLTLTMPREWEAVSNGPRQDSSITADTKSVTFAQTEPISTYLFAFAAGRLKQEERSLGGYTMRVFHCETNQKKIDRNFPEIFELHRASLEWLEDYTGIRYPFAKFDFVLIPSFQFGGMEHPGAIFYRAERLLLEESATLSEQLGRANLIAHETAHMWFGDLVTMKWFDDVWLKEVFAGFMASKIVNPSFPEINHDLKFLLEHYPPAYAIDRSGGTHPIRQQLANLDEAASLYGALIYHKAPVVMRQLELLIGDEAFRRGLQQYLSRFRFANADWPDLVAILDSESPHDLQSWSRNWVEDAGRPTVWIDGDPGEKRKIYQADPTDKGRVWTQRLSILAQKGDQRALIPLELASESLPLPDAGSASVLLPNGGGLGYGLFRLDETSKDALLRNQPLDEVSRSAAWLTLWDALLEGELTGQRLVEAVLVSLPTESEELITQQLLHFLQEAHWSFLSPEQRNSMAPAIENSLWNGLNSAGSTSLKSSYFRALQSVASSDEMLQRLEDLWREDQQIPGLVLSERDFMTLALHLVLREIDSWPEILEVQAARIEDPENRARFQFLIPSVSPNPSVREDFFQSLADVENRRREPWVLEGLQYFFHPLRNEQTTKHIRPALALLLEISQTGTIFFPKNWLDASLGNQNSVEAATIVRSFLSSNPDYPARLRGKILQSADMLFRSSEAL